MLLLSEQANWQAAIRQESPATKLGGHGKLDILLLDRVLSNMVFFVSRQAQKFIDAYAAFLKRQGKLPIPGLPTLMIPLAAQWQKAKDENKIEDIKVRRATADESLAKHRLG